MLKKTTLLFCLWGVLRASEPHHTSAFLPENGELDLLVAGSIYRTNHFWNRDGEKLPSYNRFTKSDYTLYAEYGAFPQDSLWFHGGYSAVVESVNGNSRGIEDFRLGWKHLFCENDNAAFTTQVVVGIPAGERKSSIRYGKASFELHALYSFLLETTQVTWCDLDLAYIYYNSYPSDQIYFEGALGNEINSLLTLIGSCELNYGLFNGEGRFNDNNIVFNPNYRLLKIQGECLIKCLRTVTFSVGGFGNVWGRNVGCGAGGFFGAWVVF